jgi:hypothetical protein
MESSQTSSRSVAAFARQAQLALDLEASPAASRGGIVAGSPAADIPDNLARGWC